MTLCFWMRAESVGNGISNDRISVIEFRKREKKIGCF